MQVVDMIKDVIAVRKVLHIFCVFYFELQNDTNWKSFQSKQDESHSKVKAFTLIASLI